jgi:hypothetical protein
MAVSLGRDPWAPGIYDSLMGVLQAIYGIGPRFLFMHQIAVASIYALTGMFLVGLAGSVIVILISFVEDFRELFGDD